VITFPVSVLTKIWLEPAEAADGESAINKNNILKYIGFTI
ncbi:MAG: hypothetical protein ACI8XG_000974, partial [Congregibacter sp.]